MGDLDPDPGRLRERIAELEAERDQLDARLGLALGELADAESERAASEAEAEAVLQSLEETEIRLRGATAALNTMRAQLSATRRVPGLRRLIERAAGDELYYTLNPPADPVYSGLFQVIELTGWVAHGTGRVRSVRVLAGDRSCEAVTGYARPDVADSLAIQGIAVARDCGVHVRIPVPPQRAAGTLGLRLEVLLEGGQRIQRDLGSVRVLPGTGRNPLPARWPGTGPKVAICLASYNPDRGLLAEQLDSIRAQRHTNWLCIICDDGSRPAARRALAELTSGDERFVLVENHDNLGFYGNFERALRRVPDDADAVALADQDDVWYPRKLDRLLGCLDDPRVQLAYSDMHLIDEDGDLLTDSAWHDAVNQCTDLTSLLLLNKITGAASMARAELIRERVLPFPPATPATYHDQWIAASALAAGRIAFVDESLYGYRQHGANVTGWQQHRLDQGLPGLGTLIASACRIGNARWIGTLSTAKRAELEHILYYELRRVSQFAALLLARNKDRLSPRDISSLRKLRIAERTPTPLVELALRARRGGTRHTQGAERRLLAAALWRRNS